MTARIISNELLYIYLLTKINPDEGPDVILQKLESSKDIFWTDSKNALIELIYALYASGAISHGKIGIRKISLMFQILFRIPLGDLHRFPQNENPTWIQNLIFRPAQIYLLKIIWIKTFKFN